MGIEKKIESIKVASFAKALLLNHMKPDHPVAAMYSIPFIIGCFLTRGKVGPGELTGDTLKDPQILQVAQKVVIEEDGNMSNQFPEKCLARVSLTLENGRVFHSATLSAKGDPDQPYTQEELQAKFMDLTVPLLGKETEEVYAQLMHIDHSSPQRIWNKLHHAIGSTPPKGRG